MLVSNVSKKKKRGRFADSRETQNLFDIYVNINGHKSYIKKHLYLIHRVFIVFNRT